MTLHPCFYIKYIYIQNKKHFFQNNQNDLSDKIFPIREDEPSSVYAYALRNANLFKTDAENPIAKFIVAENNEISFQCRVYHAEKFRLFRKLLNENETDYIQFSVLNPKVAFVSKNQIKMSKIIVPS